MKDVCIRQMMKEDVEGADRLRRLMGWNQTLADWRRFLELSPQGCFVATQDGFLLGTVTSLTYDQTLSWIGMMLVHPEHRRQGIGRQLMEQVLSYLQGCGVKCIKLDATPLEAHLYEQMGFVPEWTLTRWQGNGGPDTLPLPGSSHATRDLQDGDWAAVEEMDKTVLGVSRGTLIRSLALHSRRALVWPSQGKVRGWGLLRAGARADYLGPLVCCENEGALALVHDLLASAGSRLVFCDVPDQNKRAASAFQQLSFIPVRPLTRMRLGPPVGEINVQAQFAIADPSAG